MHLEEIEAKPLVISDEFNEDNNKLVPNWQWHHNPDNTAWSLTDRPGFLRLTNKTVSKKGVLYARNTLTQRTEGPACTGITCIDLINSLLEINKILFLHIYKYQQI